MERCALAHSYHEKGYNCAQSVLAAFGDLTHLSEPEALALAGALGGGFGGSHQEACGALTGALMVLGLLYPHTAENDAEAKRRIYGIAKDFQQRFQSRFSCTRCGDLLRTRIEVTDALPAAKRLGISQHCDILIVTAVEMLEEMLEEMLAERPQL